MRQIVSNNRRVLACVIIKRFTLAHMTSENSKEKSPRGLNTGVKRVRMGKRCNN